MTKLQKDCNTIILRSNNQISASEQALDKNPLTKLICKLDFSINYKVFVRREHTNEFVLIYLTVIFFNDCCHLNNEIIGHIFVFFFFFFFFLKPSVEESGEYSVMKELYDLSQERLKIQTRLEVLENQREVLEQVHTCCVQFVL